MLSGLAEIAEVGRDHRRGGYSRHLWQAADLELRSWFVERAERLGLQVETDRNGNLWAWWGQPGPDAVVTGSHLDSVPGGGAYDGPLGVVSSLEAIGRLQASGFVPTRPCAVLMFAEMLVRGYTAVASAWYFRGSSCAATRYIRSRQIQKSPPSAWV